jgi:hypothetical protein
MSLIPEVSDRFDFESTSIADSQSTMNPLTQETYQSSMDCPIHANQPGINNYNYNNGGFSDLVVSQIN